MIIRECETLADCYSELVTECIENGQLLNPRDRPCCELRPVVIKTRPDAELGLRIDGLGYKFAVAELMALLCGWRDLEWLARWAPNVKQFSDDGRTLNDAYGSRLNTHYYLDQNDLSKGADEVFCHEWDQLQKVIDELQKDPDTRQAVLAIWNPTIDQAPTKAKACNTHCYLKIRNKVLDLTVFRRSADAIWGVPPDHFLFGSLLHVLAYLLGVRPGNLVEYIDSFHVYMPEAGFYDVARVQAAMACKESWRPLQLKTQVQSLLHELREDIKEARIFVEGNEPYRIVGDSWVAEAARFLCS